MSVNLSAPLRAGAKLVVLLAVFIASPCVAQSVGGTPAQEEALARARVDLRRSQIGLPALALNAQLEGAALGHVNYLTINNLSGHDQNEEQYLNGFTGNAPDDRIRRAEYVSVPDANGSASLSTGEVVARGPFHGEDAVDSLIQAIYHRVVIFGTAFDEQGAGVGQSNQGVTVINFGSRKFPQPAAPAGWVGIYPYDGQTGIAVDFYSREESPNPVPLNLNLNRVGYPVSLHIDDARVLSVTNFTLAPVDASGNALQTLPVQLLTKAGGDAHMPASVAAIIPLGVLQYGRIYEVKFVGTADGQPLSKTWLFTTAPYADLAIAGPATAYVGDSVALKFSGGSGRYANIGYTYTGQLSQAGWVGEDGFGFHADAPGTIDVTVTDGEDAHATLSLVIKSAAEKLLPFAADWNLVGNSTNVALDVATLFGNASGNASNVTTVWKWLPATSKWAFYAPSLADGGAAYAASKGYEFLTTISPGDGFWVNAKAAFAVQLPAGAAVSSTSLRSTLGAGWNLVAAGDNRTPRGFNTVAGPAPAAGDIPINLTSLWAWDAAARTWYFYAPSLEKSGGLASYITSKNYLDFGTKMLDRTTGFWVNSVGGSVGDVPPAPGVTSDTQAPTVPTGLSAIVSRSSQINLNWTASTDNFGVTQYKVYRGGLLIAMPGTATGYSDSGLAAGTAYSYTVAACGAANNCSAQSGSTSGTTLSNTVTLSFNVGWNLVGNSSTGTLDVATVFGNTSNVLTVWKWIANGAKGAFYAPSLAGQALTDYAASKGYDVLTTVNGGEGFWVNAKTAFTVPLPSGTPISSASFQGMASGWNLIAIGDNIGPRAFNSAIGLTPPAAEDIPINLTTLWAWDAVKANWYFYAPSLDKNGGLAGYIQQKSYLDFGAKTLDPVTGFWVNRQ